jgi:hypothetical protein
VSADVRMLAQNYREEAIFTLGRATIEIREPFP